MDSNRKSNIFKNCKIHILPSGLGKKRMNLFQTQISNHGGTCVLKLPVSDCELTHIVIEDSLIKDSERCNKLLHGLCKDVKAVKVVGTQWLSKCLKDRKCVDTKEFEFLIKETDEVRSKVPVSVQSEPIVGSKIQEVRPTEEDLSDFGPEYLPPKKLKSGELQKFACSLSSSTPGAKAERNQLVITELQKLADAYRSCGDQWRTTGYDKAISAIRAYRSEITSFEEAKSIPGVGSKMAEKILEILTSGCLRKVDEICGSEKSQVVELFTKVWGVGPATALSWYQQGLRTLEDLRTKANLNNQQKIGLKHFDDIQDRMPRKEVEEIAAVVKNAALTIEPTLQVELCGSYRRGKVTCGDIDIMITRPDEMQADIIGPLITQLRKTGFITDDLVNIQENHTHKKYLGLCRLPEKDRKYRRLDIFVVPRSEYATALMHYTGSALFNRSIRLLAKRKGMSLSEHNVMSGVIRKGQDVLNEGYIVPTATEESIFEQLELEYRPPEERDH